MSFLTGSESQLLSAAVGAVIALSGGAVAQWRQGKAAAVAARARAVQETLAAADDLLAGVRMFRHVRGGTSIARALGAGIKVGMNQLGGVDVVESPSLRQKAIYGLIESILAVAPGGVMEQAIDKDASYFQGMVVPARQRLTAAVSSLRSGPNMGLAEAVDSLVRAGGELADGASSLPVKFRRLERSFERRVRQFRSAAG